MEGLPFTTEELKAIKLKFNQADKDKDGRLSKAEFASFLMGAGVTKKCEEDVINCCTKYIDENKDGWITYNEFIKAFIKVK